MRIYRKRASPIRGRSELIRVLHRTLFSFMTALYKNALGAQTDDNIHRNSHWGIWEALRLEKKGLTGQFWLYSEHAGTRGFIWGWNLAGSDCIWSPNLTFTTYGRLGRYSAIQSVGAMLQSKATHSHSVLLGSIPQRTLPAKLISRPCQGQPMSLTLVPILAHCDVSSHSFAPLRLAFRVQVWFNSYCTLVLSAPLFLWADLLLTGHCEAHLGTDSDSLSSFCSFLSWPVSSLSCLLIR